jgi:hypothetical protein
MHSTQEFYMEIQMGETTERFLIYILNITITKAPTSKLLQHQLGGTNPLFTISNLKETTNP